MVLGVFTHSDCLQHDTGPTHPEDAGRLRIIIDTLNHCDFVANISFIDAPLGKEEHILLAHSKAHLDFIKQASPSTSPYYIDADTIMSPGTFKAALRAVGAGCSAVDKVMDGTYTSAFCAIRPPGHHATVDNAMGFCIFNNIAIAALYAIQTYGLEHVAIVDFDVHHGNGTQDIMEYNAKVLYISTHQSPLFPGTGSQEEAGAGNILNIPLPPGIDGIAYREVFTRVTIPALHKFQPQLLLVSAGFDGHRDDPLASMSLVEDDYQWIGAQLKTITMQYCDGKIISFLEGGYNHKALAASVLAYLSPFAEV